LFVNSAISKNKKRSCFGKMIDKVTLPPGPNSSLEQSSELFEHLPKQKPLQDEYE